MRRVRNVTFVLMVCSLLLTGRAVFAEDWSCSHDITQNSFSFGPCQMSCSEIMGHCSNFCVANGGSVMEEGSSCDDFGASWGHCLCEGVLE